MLFLFLFVNQIEKEDQDDSKEEVTKEDFQVNGWPQLLDSRLPDPRALGQVIRLRKWRLLIRQLPMLKPGSLPGGERGTSVLCSSQGVPAALLGCQNSVPGSFGLTCSSCPLPQDVHRPPGSWDRNGSSASPCAVLQPLFFPAPGILLSILDSV